MNTAQQMIILFSPQPLLHLSQPSVQLKSCPRLRNPAWPAVWSAGEKRWWSQALTSSLSPRSSSWRKALVSIVSISQLSLESPLQKQHVPITCVNRWFFILWNRLNQRGIRKTFHVSFWIIKKQTLSFIVLNMNLTWHMLQKSAEGYGFKGVMVDSRLHLVSVFSSFIFSSV